MKLNYFLKTLLLSLILLIILSCEKDDTQSNDDYTEIPEPQPEPEPAPEEESPVILDLAQVPYQNLSSYKFFTGDIKNLEPAYKVLPYDLNSTLFTDYAHKKRFVWMPKNTQASYAADGKLLDFPAGTVLIKNFYYNNVQPANTTRIIETRLMIKKPEGWIFANYIWNENQTEATLNMAGSNTAVSFTEDGVARTISYRIPSETECLTCHKTGSHAIPIGPKPQNLNKSYNYAGSIKNQLAKWIEEGYLKNSIPADIVSTVDWTDTSKPLELRVRSYLDINCAHCHTEGAHCDYRPLRFAFTETGNPVNMGVCVQPQEVLQNGQNYIVARGNALRSVLHYRLNSVNEAERMPLLGRTIVHDEGVAMIKEWINSMDTPCP